MRTKPATLTLDSQVIAILDAEGERRSLSRSAMARLIIRQWAEGNVRAIGKLPHPLDAEEVPIVYVEKQQ